VRECLHRFDELIGNHRDYLSLFEAPACHLSYRHCLMAMVVVMHCTASMCEQEIADEFSHTVMHGIKLQKALVPGSPAARPLPPKPIAGLCIRYETSC